MILKNHYTFILFAIPDRISNLIFLTKSFTMKQFLWFVFFFALCLTAQVSFSQAPTRGNSQGNMPMDAKVTGTIIDADNNQGVEYASVAIYKQKDSTLIKGVMSTTNGKFVLDNLPYGKFYIEINFVGYKKQRVPNILLNPNQKTANAGIIKINSTSTSINEVDIVGTKSNIEYRIDKKVVDVSQNVVAAGGTVVDALQNTPSVQTDVEGNVTLRGSSNFTVLIDGKLSPVSGSEALQQIPASIVQNVEIITNPSAKYDAEGSAGIINVIMKKQKIRGFNGVVNLTAGTNEKYSGNININYKVNKFNFSIGADFTDMKFLASSQATALYSKDTIKGYSTEDNQFRSGSGSFHRQGKGLKGGIDYNINEKNTLSLTGSIGDRAFNRPFTYNQTDMYSNPVLGSIYTYNSTNGEYIRNYYNLILNYQLKLNDNGHQLATSLYLTQGPEDNNNINYQDTTNINGNTFVGKNPVNTQSRQNSNETEFRANVDYTLPLSDKGKIEAGYQGRIYQNLGDQHIDTALVNGIWLENFSQLDKIIFKDQIEAGYATLSEQTNIIDFMVGARAEYENRNFTQEISNTVSIVNQLNIFPSVHLSKQLPWDLQLNGSYTKRINRPRDWMIDPLKVHTNPLSIQSGNPNLLPELANSFELSLQKKFNEASYLTVEGFYRETDNPMESVNRPVNDTIYSTNVNYDYDRSAGVEIMLNLALSKWFIFNASSSIYNDYLYAGDKSSILNYYYVANRSENIGTWNIKINPSFRLQTGTSAQINFQYNAPSNAPQGTRKGNYSNSIGIRQDMLKHKGSLTLQIRDFIPGVISTPLLHNMEQ